MTDDPVSQQNPEVKSLLCRICGEESKHGQRLFHCNEDIQKLAMKICSYISIKLKHARLYPNWICPGCRLQFESTNQFFQLIRNGQQVLADKFGKQPRRGRKPKRIETESRIQTEPSPPEFLEPASRVLDMPINGRKREPKPPERLKDTMQGNELEELYSDMGITRRPTKDLARKSKMKIIAHIENDDGETVGDMLVIPQHPQRTCTRYQCDVCKERFTLESVFLKHVTMHTNILYECTQCEKSFSSKVEFDEHQTLENHKGLGIIEMPFTEPTEVATETKENMLIEETVEKELKKSLATRFVCVKCPKSFRTKNAMKLHQLTHSHNRPYKCAVCSVAFKKKSILEIHKAIHTGERPFKCTKCPKSFAHKQTLKAHLRAHDGLKPYQCTICQKSFSQLGNMKEHKRIHTGERPYVCLICGISFKTSSQCRVHQSAHAALNEQPPKSIEFENIHKSHSCKWCDKRFSHRSGMIKHLRTHTGEKPYMCHLCTKRFADPSNFKKHKRFHARQVERQKANSASLLKQRLTQVSLNSDPDPDGFLSMNSMPSDSFIPTTRSLMDLLDDDNDRGSKTWGLLRESSDPIITEVHNDDSSLIQPQQSVANQLVCISYQDPMNPVSSKTTFYVVN